MAQGCWRGSTGFWSGWRWHFARKRSGSGGASKWLADVQGAAELGLSPHHVAWAALFASVVAPRRRPRTSHNRVASALRTVKIVGGVTAAVLVAFFWMPLGIVLAPVALVATVVVVSIRGGTRVRACITGALAGIWLISSVAAWWLWGVAFDLADANQSTAGIDVYLGPAFITATVSFFALIVLGFAALVRSSRRRSPAGAPTDT